MTTASPSLSIVLDADQLAELADSVAERLIARLPQPAEDSWLDSRAAVAYLGLPSLDALHRLTAADAIPHSQIGPGAKLYFRRSELDAWRSQGHVEPRF